MQSSSRMARSGSFPVLAALLLAVEGCSSRKAMVTPAPEPSPVTAGIQPAMTELLDPADRALPPGGGALSKPDPAPEPALPPPARMAQAPAAPVAPAKRSIVRRRAAPRRVVVPASPAVIPPPKLDHPVRPPEPGIVTRAGLFLLLLLLAVIAGIAYWLRHRGPPPGSPRGPGDGVPRPPMPGPPPAAPPPVRATPVGAAA